MIKGTIGIIGGTGKQGSGIAKRLLREGNHIVIGSRLVERGKKVADDIRSVITDTSGSITGGDNKTAVQSNIIILAIPADQVKPLIYPLKEDIKGKIVLDMAVNIKFGKFSRAMKIDGLSVFEYIRNLFPDSKIVSCFKTISAHSLNSDEELNLVDFQMSTDDEAIAIAAELSSSIGLKPIRIRGRVHAITIERMVALAIQINKEYPGSHTGFNLVNLS